MLGIDLGVESEGVARAGRASFRVNCAEVPRQDVAVDLGRDEVVIIEGVGIDRAVLVQMVSHQEVQVAIVVEIRPRAGEPRTRLLVKHTALHDAVLHVVVDHLLLQVLRGNEGQGRGILGIRVNAEEEVGARSQGVLLPSLPGQGLRSRLLQPHELALLVANGKNAVLAPGRDDVLQTVPVHVHKVPEVVEPACLRQAPRNVLRYLHRVIKLLGARRGLHDKNTTLRMSGHEESAPNDQGWEAEDRSLNARGGVGPIDVGAAGQL
mmetsp:Transcript_55977/g.120465  ORF Transcript_55977/g.120465 Transcript_55977/m.120465 type:complete len:265 (+) Transcript_55977:485-1279(+)